MPVDTLHHSYENMTEKWQRLRDCFEGRDAVVARGAKYLPALPGNPSSDYGMRGNFYNAVRRTVQGLAGAVMQKAPSFTMPAPIPEEYLSDLTLGDVSAETFVLDTIQEVLLVGRFGVLIDMSSNPDTGPRPYLVGYPTEDIVSWRSESHGGDEVLTRVVLRETIEIPDPKDDFVTKTDTQYRVLELTEGGYTQTVWKKESESSDKYVASEPETPLRRGAPLPFIPFIPIGPTSGSPEPERPPLLDLADVNLAHWRNSADHEYGLHLVALPTPWVAGQKGSDDNKALKIGPSVVWELDKDGGAGMLEFTGKGLEAIEKAMDAKRSQMSSLGARLLEEQAAVQETATAVGMRHSGEHATLRMVAQSVEQRLTRALQIIAWWTRTEEKPEDTEAGVELNKEFWAVRATPEEIKSALLAYQADAISFATFYERLQKGGWAREGITAEEEQKEIGRGGGALSPEIEDAA